MNETIPFSDECGFLFIAYYYYFGMEWQFLW